MTALADSDLAALATVVPRVVGGEASAWTELVLQLEPHLMKLLHSSRSLGPLRHSLDDCRAVMISVLERLRKDDFRGLRLFLTWAEVNPGKDFGDWIRIVTVNTARDHMSSRLGERTDLNKRMLNTLASLLPADDDTQLAFRPEMTDAQLARELLEYATRSLEATQLRALRRWMDGASHDELARDLGLASPREADKLVRAALARLRRHFGESHD